MFMAQIIIGTIIGIIVVIALVIVVFLFISTIINVSRIKKAKAMEDEISEMIKDISAKDLNVELIETSTHISTKTSEMKCVYIAEKSKQLDGKISFDCYIPMNNIYDIRDSIQLSAVSLNEYRSMDGDFLKISISEGLNEQFKANVIEQDIELLEAKIYAVAVELKESPLKDKIREWRNFLYEYIHNHYIGDSFFEDYQITKLLLSTFTAERIQLYLLIEQPPMTEKEIQEFVEIVVEELKYNITTGLPHRFNNSSF